MRLLAPLLALAVLAAGCTSRGETQDDPPVETLDLDEPSAQTPTPAPATPPSATTSGDPTPPSSSSTPAPAPQEPAEAPAPPPPPRIDVHRWDGSLTQAGFGIEAPPFVSLCCRGVTLAEENTEGTFELPAGLKGIVAELAWTDAQFDLDLALHAPDAGDAIPPELRGTTLHLDRGHSWADKDGNPGSPDGRAWIIVTDEEALALAGTWSWSVHSKTANDVAFQVMVSLFYDTTPSEGYSALPT